MFKVITAFICSILLASTAQAAGPDWSTVEKYLGRKGMVEDNMLKVTFPRSDLNVKVGDFTVSPGLALTSWFAFRQEADATSVMGDLVLREEEVAPVMKKLMSQHIWVTALHNHLMNEKPRVMYMHFGGRGDAGELALSLKSALMLTGTPLGPPPPPDAAVAKAIDWSKVEKFFGKPGRASGNVVSFSFQRAKPVTEMGAEIPAFMGMATAVNMQAGGDKSVAYGDFVLEAGEVEPVAETLVSFGLSVTAIHNHMLFEEPRLFFMHFWGVGDPAVLAEGIRAALEKTATTLAPKGQ